MVVGWDDGVAVQAVRADDVDDCCGRTFRRSDELDDDSLAAAAADDVVHHIRCGVVRQSLEIGDSGISME